MDSDRCRERSGARPRFFTLLALAVLLVIGVGGVTPWTALAEPDNVVKVNPPQLASHNGSPILEEGKTYSFTIGHGMMTPGSQTAIEIPKGLSVPGTLTIPEANSTIAAIDVVTNEAGVDVVTITWANPWPDGIYSGVYGLNLTVDEVGKSAEEELLWRIDGQEVKQEFVVLKAGDQPAQLGDSFHKWADGPNLSQYITVNDEGVVSLSEDAFEVELPYEVHLDSSQALGKHTITDTLGAWMTMADGSASVQITTWDDLGLNKETSTATATWVGSGSSRSLDLDISGPSKVVVKYKAKLDINQREALLAALQAAHDSVAATGGWWQVELANTATGLGRSHSANRSLGGNAPNPNPTDPTPTPSAPQLGASKTIAPHETEAVWDAAGTLEVPLALDYTITTDTTAWNGSDAAHTLTAPVILRDRLPYQASFATGQTGWLVLRDASGNEVELTAIDGGEDPEQAIKAASPFSYVLQPYVNPNWTADAGTYLLVNLGTDDTVYTLHVRALLESVAGLSGHENSGIVYRNFTNYAGWELDGVQIRSQQASTFVHSSDDEGTQADHLFNKSGPEKTVVKVGESAALTYTFFVGYNLGTPIVDGVIVDHVDHDVFDVTEENLDEIHASLSGRHEGNGFTLVPADFDLLLNASGDLEIRVNDTGLAKLDEWEFKDAFRVSITLPTHVFDSKVSLEVVNRASFLGADNGSKYIDSAESDATSYGDELEVSKHLYDPAAKDWTTSLRAELDDGKLRTDEFIYRVRLMPHGMYSFLVTDVVDLLPEGVEFLGFLNSVDGQPTKTTSFAVPNSNLQATYDGVRTVTVKSGPNMTPGQNVDVLFKVKVTDYAEDQGISNFVGSRSATIVPTDGYPLDVVKVDGSNSAKLITDTDARFSVTAADGQVVTDEAYVVDGMLKVAGENGAHAALLVQEPGTYTIRELKAPAGYLLTDAVFTATVTPDGMTTQVRIVNAPAPVVVTHEIFVEKLGTPSEGGGLQRIDGAAFELRSDDAGEMGAPMDGVTVAPNGEGYFKVGDLLSGTSYWLLETKAPDGYTLLPEAVRFTLDDDGSVVLDDPDQPLVSVAAAGDTIKVVNLPVLQLPFVGSNEAAWRPVTLLVLPAIAFGFVLLLAHGQRRNRPEHRRQV